MKIPKGFDLKAAIGQMVIVSFPGAAWNRNLADLIKNYEVGGVIFFKENIKNSPLAIKKLTAKIKKAALNGSLRLPPFISVDEEGGRVSRLRGIVGKYKSQRELSAMNSITKLKVSYAEYSRKIKKLGFNIGWSPVLDIDTNPNNPVIANRSFSADACEVVKCGREAIRSIAGAGVYTSAKHFPGHGDTSVDSHLALPVQETSRKLLERRELLPFKMAVAQRVDFIMTAHILFNRIDKKQPVTFSKKFLTGILRKEMNYKGLIVTDDLNMRAVAHKYNTEEKIKLAVNAGADLLLIRAATAEAKRFLEIFYSLAKSGEIPLARIRESLARIKRIKRKLA